MDKNKLIKPLILIVVIIVFCSVLTRVFSGAETLSEYAYKNPEIAYQEKEEPEESKTPRAIETQEALGTQDATETTEVHTIAEEGSNSDTDSESSKQNAAQTDNASETDSTTGSTADESTDNNNIQESEDTSMAVNPDRVVYQKGFYYEPLSDEIIKRITGISYPMAEENKNRTVTEAVNIVSSPEDIQVAYDDLRYLSVLYYNFKGIERTGELICNKAIAQDLAEIFYELYQNEYQIEQIHLIDEYSGDDTLSMQDNNTSCFNYRVVDGTTSLSKHALGLAIDINPFFNPYVVYKEDGTTYISPRGSETYADRSKDFAYKIDENDLCYRLFKEHGFIWGGDWNSRKDYQHFQKVPE